MIQTGTQDGTSTSLVNWIPCIIRGTDQGTLWPAAAHGWWHVSLALPRRRSFPASWTGTKNLPEDATVAGTLNCLSEVSSRGTFWIQIRKNLYILS